jgi:diadenylate cyclase
VESASTADFVIKKFEHICPKASWCPRKVLDTVIELAIEIAREGREGRRIGTLFTLGFADSVLRNSRALILDPIAAHPREARLITDLNVRGTIKELAQLDGAFVLDEDGTVQAACRYLDTSSKDINMTFGLGSRHLAGASISRETNAIAIVVSESAVVRIFYDGCLQAEILPELWLLSRHSLHLRGPLHQDSLQDVAIFTAEDAVTKAEQSR